MSFINEIKEKAKKEIKNIILTESEDVRVLKAAEQIKNEAFANIILIGNEEEANKLAKDNDIDISGIKIIEPISSEKYDEDANAFYELR